MGRTAGRGALVVICSWMAEDSPVGTSWTAELSVSCVDAVAGTISFVSGACR